MFVVVAAHDGVWYAIGADDKALPKSDAEPTDLGAHAIAVTLEPGLSELDGDYTGAREFDSLEFAQSTADRLNTNIAGYHWYPLEKPGGGEGWDDGGTELDGSTFPVAGGA